MSRPSLRSSPCPPDAPTAQGVGARKETVKMNVTELLEQELAGLEEMAAKSKYATAYTDYIGKLRAEIARLKNKARARAQGG